MSNRVAGPASKTVVVVTGKAKTRLRQVYVAASFMIFPNTQLGRATALRRRLDGVGFRPPMVSVKLPKSEVSGFSSLESNEVAKFFQVKVERVAHFESRLLLVLSCPFAQVGQGSLLSGMSGLTAHDARYASFQEERARPTYQRVLSTQGRTRARAAPKSKRVKSLVAG